MESVDNIDIQSEKGFKLARVNTRSVLNKLDDIRINFEIFDVVVRTETWLDASTHDSIINWPGYSHVRLDRSQFRDKRGEGLCIYIKSKHNFEVVPLQMCNVDRNI